MLIQQIQLGLLFLIRIFNMKLCNILDYNIINNIINKTNCIIPITVLYTFLKTESIKIFINSKETSCIIFVPVDEYKYNLHLYTTERRKLKELKSFIYKTGYWMFNNTSATCLINFVKESRKDLILLMPYLHTTKVGILKNSNDGENEIMYCAFKEDYPYGS